MVVTHREERSKEFSRVPLHIPDATSGTFLISDTVKVFMGNRASIAVSFRLVLSFLVLVATLVVFAVPRPAHACSCDSGLPSELLESSDLAFVGVVVDQQPSFGDESIESLINVSSVLKGDVEASIIVDSPVEDGCGQVLASPDPVGVTAVLIPGDVLPQVCSVMAADQLLAAGEQLGLEITTPPIEELATDLPESASNYAAAIPLSIILSLVFLAAVAIGTRTTTVSSR